MKPTTTPTPGTNVEPAEFGAVYHQRFAVEYDYPVHFTHDLFARDNPAFVSALARKEPNKRHRFVVFIDADVAASWPALPHDIAAYAEHHATRLQLLAPAEIIVGGEQVKHDPELVTRLQHRLLELGVDRHAYVVAVGGGAFLDVRNFQVIAAERTTVAVAALGMTVVILAGGIDLSAGTATALADVPGPPVHVKTGTAEFNDNPADTHAWTIGWQGDIAFAVFVESGGGSAETAVPIVEAFLRGLA